MLVMATTWTGMWRPRTPGHPGTRKFRYTHPLRQCNPRNWVRSGAVAGRFAPLEQPLPASCVHDDRLASDAKGIADLRSALLVLAAVLATLRFGVHTALVAGSPHRPEQPSIPTLRRLLR